MMEPVAFIRQIESAISGRLRLMAVQDLIALSLLVSAAVAALAFFLFKLGLFDARIAAGIGKRERLLACSVPVVAGEGVFPVWRVLREPGGGGAARWGDPHASKYLFARSLGT